MRSLPASAQVFRHTSKIGALHTTNMNDRFAQENRLEPLSVFASPRVYSLNTATKFRAIFRHCGTKRRFRAILRLGAAVCPSFERFACVGIKVTR